MKDAVESAPRLLMATEGTRLAWIAGQPYLFVPERQSFCAVIPEAAALWPSLEVGVAEDRAAARLGDGAVLRTIADLMSVGAIDILSSADGIAPVTVTETLALGSMTALVAFADEELRCEMMPSFAHLRVPPRASNEQVVVMRDGDRVGVARRDRPVSWGKANQGVPRLKIALTDAALARIEGLALHAATLLRKGRAMLLLGNPGAGKSTLGMRLNGAGFTLAGDDLTELYRDGTVRAHPFAITLKRGSWGLFEGKDGNTASVQTFRRPDGKRARYLPIDPTVAEAAREVGWIVVLDRKAASAPSLSKLSTPDAFASLLGAAWSGRADLAPDEFAALATCIDGAQCVRFTYSDLDAAADTLGRFCDGGEA